MSGNIAKEKKPTRTMESKEETGYRKLKSQAIEKAERERKRAELLKKKEERERIKESGTSNPVVVPVNYSGSWVPTCRSVFYCSKCVNTRFKPHSLTWRSGKWQKMNNRVIPKVECKDLEIHEKEWNTRVKKEQVKEAFKAANKAIVQNRPRKAGLTGVYVGTLMTHVDYEEEFSEDVSEGLDIIQCKASDVSIPLSTYLVDKKMYKKKKKSKTLNEADDWTFLKHDEICGSLIEDDFVFV